MKRRPTPAATPNDSPTTDRMIGRVVSTRPAAPGVIVVPGNKPDRFVFSSTKVANVEIGDLVTLVPLPPRKPEHDCGQAADVQFALAASEVPRYDAQKRSLPTHQHPPKRFELA